VWVILVSRLPNGKPPNQLFQERHPGPEKIKSHDQQIEQAGANRAQRFVSSRAGLNLGAEPFNPAQTAKLAIKVRIFQQRLIRVLTGRKKTFPATEKAPVPQGDLEHIYTSVAQRVPDAVNPPARDNFETEATAHHRRVTKRTFDHSERVCGDARVRVHEPKNVPVRDLSAGIHLSRPPASCLRNVVGEAVAKRLRSIGAASVHDDDLGGGRDQAQMLQERADNRRFIQDRDNNRNQHGGLTYYFTVVLCMLNRTP
jgi:hypothetical protein